MNQPTKTDSCISAPDDKSFTKFLLHGDDRYDSETNESIILASIRFIELLALFRFRCLPHYISEPDNEISS